MEGHMFIVMLVMLVMLVMRSRVYGDAGDAEFRLVYRG